MYIYMRVIMEKVKKPLLLSFTHYNILLSWKQNGALFNGEVVYFTLTGFFTMLFTNWTFLPQGCILNYVFVL